MKIGIIGAGYMAAEHARAFASCQGVELVGLCGRSTDRARLLASNLGIPVFENATAMSRATHLDGFVVAVNELSMRSVCDEVFRLGIPCLLEKPVGIDLAEARQIERMAKSSGVEHHVALNRRSYASTVRAIESLKAQGSTRVVSILDQQDMQAAREFGQPEEVVQNYMFANSIHLVDYFALFCRGEVSSVNVLKPWIASAPGHVVCTISYDSGDVGIYQAIWDGPGPWAVAISDSDVRLEMRPLESLTVQSRGERRTHPVDLGTTDLEFKPGLKLQAERFLAVLDGHERGYLASLTDATNSMQLCARIYGLD